MRLRSLLTSVVILVLVLLVAGIVLLRTMSFDRYRQFAADEVRALTGRELVVEGPVHLELSLHPALTVDDVRFANAPWGSEPQMLTVHRFEARVDLLPLLSGTVKVDRVMLSGVSLLLETDPKGRGNWEFGGAGAAHSGGGTSLPEVHDLRAEDLKITYHDGRTGRRMVLRFARLQATTPGPGAAAKLEAEGAYDGNPFRLQGDVGPVADLVAGRPLPIRLDVHAGDADLKLDGRAGVAGAVGKGPELALQIAGGGPELAAFGAFAGARLPPLGPWRAGLHFSGSAGEMQLSGLKASVAGSDLAGDVTVEMDGPRPRVSGKLESSVLDLKSLAHSGAGKPAAAHSAGRVFPRTPIPVGFLNDLDGSIDYRAAKVLLPALELHHLALRARLADGSLTVDPVSMDLDPGSIRGSIGLARAQPGAAVRVNLKGEKLDAGSLLLKLAHSALLSGGDTSFALDVHGRGTSPAAVAGSLEGGAKLLMGPAQARATELDTLVGGASQMLGTLFARSSDTTRLNCAAADFHLVHGVAHSRLLLVDTQYSTVRGHGDIDLGHETLHLKVIPQPKSATLNVAVPVNVSGTLGDPKFAPDEFAAARKIGGILGVVLFPPAAIAGLTELGTGEANPCLNIAAGRSATAGAEQSPAGGSVVDKAAEGVKGAVQGIDSALKGLFGSGDGSGGATGGSGAATGRDLKGGH